VSGEPPVTGCAVVEIEESPSSTEKMPASNAAAKVFSLSEIELYSMGHSAHSMLSKRSPPSPPDSRHGRVGADRLVCPYK